MRVRRVVTGHTPDGKATITSDMEIDGIEFPLTPGPGVVYDWNPPGQTRKLIDRILPHPPTPQNDDSPKKSTSRATGALYG